MSTTDAEPRISTAQLLIVLDELDAQYPSHNARQLVRGMITELLALRPIVAAVADLHPLDDEMGYCLFCTATRGQQHDADCEWIRARALVPDARHGD